MANFTERNTPLQLVHIGLRGQRGAQPFAFPPSLLGIRGSV